MNANQIPLIIPSLEPDDRLPALLTALKQNHIENIVLVNDGSSPAYDSYFENAKAEGCHVLTHAVNLGKGRALKDAFNYCLTKWPDAPGCVTADSDGQHTPACILSCMQAMLEHPDALILGCRDFNSENVPQKSKYGNQLTCFMFSAFVHLHVSDTQTGLRGISRAYMEKLLSVPGERFEFETNMLIDAKRLQVPLTEIPIETIYDSKENHTTHFNPVKDSIRIYRLFGGCLTRALIWALVDIALFCLFFFEFGSSRAPILLFCANLLAKLLSKIPSSYRMTKEERRSPLFLLSLVAGPVIIAIAAQYVSCSVLLIKIAVDLICALLFSVIRFKLENRPYALNHEG